MTPVSHKRRGLALVAPTLRLVLFAVLSLGFALLSSLSWAAACFLVALSILIAGQVLPKALLVGSITTGLLTFALNALMGSDGPSWSLGFIDLSAQSVETGVIRGLRIASMMFLAVAYVAVTPKTEMLQGMRGLGLRGSAELYLTIVFRYIDIFTYEFETAVRAVKIRGLRIDEGGIRERLRAYASLLMSLMARVLNRVETQALAVDSRGLRGKKGPRAESREGPAISVTDLSVTYAREPEPPTDLALQGITLEVPADDFVLVAGPTGAGKTTLLMSCSGLIPHSLGRMRGRVALAGQDTHSSQMPTLASLARLVFADPVHGMVGLTVRDELQLVGRTTSCPLSPSEALSLVGLDEGYLDRSTLHLSGGEMQRVQIASALVSGTPIVLLDEPTVQLDPRGKREVIEAVRGVSRALSEPITIVIADPNVDAIKDLLNRVVLLDEGGLTAAGEASPQVALSDGDWMDRAHLRVPQLVRLARAIAVDLPSAVEGAVEMLRTRRWEVVPRLPHADRDDLRDRPRRSLVEASGVRFIYGDATVAVRGVDLAIDRGEFAFVLGRNGSGKTTLGLILAGALEASEGRIQLHQGARVGYVFQEPSLQVVSTTVADELAFGPRNLGWDAVRVEAAVERELDRFGLSPDEHPLDVSPAETRKLAIGSLLAMDPDVLVLDEPTNGLDELESRELCALLTEVNRQGTALLVISHDVELACEFATRVIVMNDGRIIIDDEPRSAMTKTELLKEAFVEPPPVVRLSHALSKGGAPALSVEELADWLTPTGEAAHDAAGGEPLSPPKQSR